MIEKTFVEGGLKDSWNGVLMIESYQFGIMTIDGKNYTCDLIIKRDKVISDWWRNEGHRLHPDDLEEFLTEYYDLIIIGTGASGIMEVPLETEEFLKSKTSELVIDTTDKAYRKYNQNEGKHVLAAFHLTC